MDSWMHGCRTTHNLFFDKFSHVVFEVFLVDVVTRGSLQRQQLVSGRSRTRLIRFEMMSSFHNDKKKFHLYSLKTRSATWTIFCL